MQFLAIATVYIGENGYAGPCLIFRRKNHHIVRIQFLHQLCNHLLPGLAGQVQSPVFANLVQLAMQNIAGTLINIEKLAISQLHLIQPSTFNQDNVFNQDIWLQLLQLFTDPLGVRELIDLAADQRRALSDETDLALRLLQQGFRPHKLNVAALGNLVPQLHVHVIARFEDDPAWPAPVWGRVAARPYTPEALVERIAALQALLPR